MYDRGVCTFTISDVALEDRGTYKCLVSNDFGTTFSTSDVNVTKKSTKPEMKDKMKNAEAYEEDEARFVVHVTGYPTPECEWFHGTRKLVNDDKYTIDEPDGQVYSLLVKNIKRGDAGSYKCVASNDAGKVSTRAELVVKEKEFAPQFEEEIKDQFVKEGKPVDVSCKINAKPKAEVTWSKDGQRLFETRNQEFSTHGNSHSLYIRKASPSDVGTYTCEAKNKIGSSVMSFAVQVEGNFKYRRN